MIRENQNYLNKFQILLDILIVTLSFFISYYIRFYILDGGQSSLSIHQTVLPILTILPIYFLLYNLFDLYSPRRIKSLHVEVGAIVKTNLFCFLILILLLFIFKIIDFSRLVLFIFLIVNTLNTVIMRVTIRYFLKKYRRKGYNQKFCLIVGTSTTASNLIKKINNNKHWGYNIIGVVDLSSSFAENAPCYEELAATTMSNYGIFDSYPILGNSNNLSSLLSNLYIDIVIIALDGTESSQLGQVIYECEKSGVKTNIIPYYYQYIPAKPYMDDLDGLPIIDTRHVPLDNLFKHLLKRVFDIIFSLFAIILISPVLIFSAIMVRITSPGPIIFKQERMGLNRKTFYMYKFRSMKLQTEDDEKDKWTTPSDPRKTKWGAFMRKTSIDELPQFFNVLKGDMSVVGPRPERPFFVDKFKEEIPRYMIKHQVRPGITGWAQVNGFRGDTSIEGRIEHDLYYIENWSFSFDLKIIFLTIFKGFVNKNAY
ncbi:MAG: undecaprenyl-phosphate glucose phosphotransferase [Cellulosilyticaceae bacterium]